MKFVRWIAPIAAVLLASCGEPTQYRGADFSSLNQCMSGLQREIGEQLKIVVDEPEKVTGSQNDGTFWACVKKSTGTKGIYWEGYYTAKNNQKKNSPAQSVTPSVTTGAFSKAQVCMAGIAMMNGHSPHYDNVSENENEVTLKYTRKTDGKKFTYGCYLSENEVKWRLHPQSSWSKNNQIFFTANDNSITVRQVVLGETIESKVFNLADLAN